MKSAELKHQELTQAIQELIRGYERESGGHIAQLSYRRVRNVGSQAQEGFVLTINTENAPPSTTGS